MGCCFCRPTSVVTEDPNVAMYADVGTCVMIQPEGDYAMLSGFLNGLLYVKGGTLYYTTVAGKMFWCECVASEWGVSDIKRAEVITGTVTIRAGPRGHPQHLNMNPGLKIKFRNHNTLLTAMPEAVNFCADLREYLSSIRGEGDTGGGKERAQSNASSVFMASLDMYTPATANFVTVTPTTEADSHSKEAQENL